MSVIIDATMSEVESVIKYARYGANNCMIGDGWGINELVQCKDCKHWNDSYLPEGCGWCEKDNHGRLSDFFCKSGERRSE